MATTNFTQFT